MDELIKESKKGNPDAFTELMQMQMQNMYKVARAILHNEEDVADAISDTILACFEKMKQLKKNEYFRTWMTRILIHKCYDLLKKKEHILYTEEVPETLSGNTNFENVEWKETLNLLNEKYRLVMILYYVEGFKTDEISQLLTMPISTVRTRLARGRKQLSVACDLERREKVCRNEIQ